MEISFDIGRKFLMNKAHMLGAGRGMFSYEGNKATEQPKPEIARVL